MKSNEFMWKSWDFTALRDPRYKKMSEDPSSVRNTDGLQMKSVCMWRVCILYNLLVFFCQWRCGGILVPFVSVPYPRHRPFRTVSPSWIGGKNHRMPICMCWCN